MKTKTYEIKLVVDIDADNKEAFNQLHELKEHILSGEAQRELTDIQQGILKVSATFSEIK